MAEELKSLLDRIQRDGVERAETERARIVEEAEARAAAIVEEAGKKAAAARAAAEQDAAAFRQRAERSLQQAARDVVLSVGETLKRALDGLVTAEINGAVDEETLKTLVQAMVEAYAGREGDSRLEVLVTPAQQKTIEAYFRERFAERLRGGLDVKGDDSVVSGFRVSMDNGQVQHDLTGPAIAEAMSRLLRPQIGEIVKKAMASDANDQ